MTVRRFLAKVAVAVAVAASMPSAMAAVVNFYNGSNLYATMTTGGGTTFSLFFNGTGSSGAFINELFLDGPSGTFTNTTAAGVTTPSATYSLNGYNGGGGAGNIYDWKIDFPQPNNAGRFTTGETATWTINVTDPNAWSVEKLHINAFDGQTSIKLDGCVQGTTGCGPGKVPEPTTIALLGLGLLSAGLARRRLGAKK